MTDIYKVSIFKSALVQVMAWWQTGTKPLHDPMLIHSPMYLHDTGCIYRKISNIRRIKSQNLNVCRLVLQLSLPNPMKPGVKSRMKM